MSTLDDDQLLSTVQAAKLCNVTSETVRDWIRRDRLTAVKVGRRYRVRLSEIRELIAGYRNVDGSASARGQRAAGNGDQWAAGRLALHTEEMFASATLDLSDAEAQR